MCRPEGGEDARETWYSKLTVLLATIGYAVNFENIWRFPYIDQKNVGLLKPCSIYCFHSFCVKFRSFSRQVVWPVDSNNMCDT